MSEEQFTTNDGPFNGSKKVSQNMNDWRDSKGLSITPGENISLKAPEALDTPTSEPMLLDMGLHFQNKFKGDKNTTVKA